MKLYLFSFILCFQGLFANAQWAYMGLGGQKVNQLTINNDTIYASCNSGLYSKYVYATDTNWNLVGLSGKKVVNTAFVGPQSCISIVEVVPNRSLIFKSANRGRSYSLYYTDTSLNYPYSWNNHIGKNAGNDTLYFLHHNIKTYDGGLTWLPLSYPYTIDKFIYVSPYSAADVYAGGENYILAAHMLHTQDAGNTWNNVNTSSYFGGDNAIHAIEIRDSDLYAVGEGVIVHKKINNTSWTQLLNVYTDATWGMYFYGLAMSPVNNNFIYVSGSNNNASGNAVRLLLSKNKGVTWDSLSFNPVNRTDYGTYDIKVQRRGTNDILWLGGIGMYTYTLPVPAGINTPPGGVQQISLYPNPAKDYIQIRTGNANKNMQVSVTNLFGQTVYTTQTTAGNLEIPIFHLVPGMYNCTITTDNSTTTKRFVKQ